MACGSTRMSELLTVGVGLLIVITIGPLVLLLFFRLIGDRLGSGVERRLLDATVGLLTLQWLTGGWINMIGGTALATLGVWTVFHDVQTVHKVVALVILLPGGLWRAWHGFVLARGEADCRFRLFLRNINCELLRIKAYSVDANPRGILTQVPCKCSCWRHDPGPRQIKLAAAVHMALERFQAADDALDLTA